MHTHHPMPPLLPTVALKLKLVYTPAGALEPVTEMADVKFPLAL